MFTAMAGRVVLGAIVVAVVLTAGAAIAPANAVLTGGDFQNSFTLSRHYCNRLSHTLKL
jgi:hypothetical protein